MAPSIAVTRGLFWGSFWNRQPSTPNQLYRHEFCRGTSHLHGLIHFPTTQHRNDVDEKRLTLKPIGKHKQSTHTPNRIVALGKPRVPFDSRSKIVDSPHQPEYTSRRGVEQSGSSSGS